MGSGSIATPTVAPTPTAAATIVPVLIVTLPDDGGLPWCVWLLLLLLLLVVAGIIAYWRRAAAREKVVSPVMAGRHRRLCAAEGDNGDLAVGTGAVGSEAWVPRSHLVVQRGTLLSLGYVGLGGEALPTGIDGNVRVGGDVQVPRGMVVLTVV